MEKRRRSHWIKALIVLSDAVLITGALYGSYLVRFDFNVWPQYQFQFARLLPIVVLVRITALYYRGGYRSLWKYTSLSDLNCLLQGVLVGSVLLMGVNFLRNYPLSIALALAFLASAVFYRGFHLFRVSSRALVFGLVAVAVVILCGGVYFFTVLTSAPISIAELPLGHYLVSQDFQDALVMPRAVVVLETILSFLLIGGVRLGPRLAREVYSRRRSSGRRVLVFGAGDSGENLVRAMVNHPEFGYQPIGFIDDHPAKQRVSIHGVDVLGTRRDLLRVIERLGVEELMIAISDLSASDLREVAAVCLQKHIPVRRVPGVSLLLDDQASLQSLEEVDLENLLGRSEVELDPERVIRYLQGRVVLVTGAGGSIGSELCRQISRCRPAQLLLLGKGENSIYQIQHELAAVFPEQKTICVIGDIGNPGKMEFLFGTYHPQVVFHTGAHKHVPFMEDCPEEAVLNNVFGTQTVARAALKHMVERFVLISSDKAVNPSSVMGTTKKIAELILQQLAPQGSTQFITVRFGNVLRSRGSVMPLFEQQIRAGGPVTVTHPEMTRYFMSIPEAVRLVLHSGAIGKNGDLCILDMGEPVRIAALAENMIRMAGKRPYEEIDIVFTGIRAGEKLTEILFTEAEARTLQKADKLLLCRPEGCDWEHFDERLVRLKQAAEGCLREEVIGLLKEIIPAYQPFPSDIVASGLHKA
ncbi:MAG: polysaccharide biosynthesis protein [Candidatus Latescibacteria bacterium]|nr:polysaccharide biosynthesis protein [Candidatus Latescibacterota bacterium]